MSQHLAVDDRGGVRWRAAPVALTSPDVRSKHDPVCGSGSPPDHSAIVQRKTAMRAAVFNRERARPAHQHEPSAPVSIATATFGKSLSVPTTTDPIEIRL